MNEATRWRQAVAQKVAARYAENPKVSAVALAGSVARGWADRHSDIELDVYWHEPPTDDDRLRIVTGAGRTIDIFWANPPSEAQYQQIFRRTGGHLSQLWPYEDGEWSEHYYVHGVNIGISGFLTTTTEGYLADVLQRYTTDDEPQIRLAAIRHGVALHGADLIERWQTRAVRFPRPLAVALVSQQLARDEAWWASDMWVERGAHLALMNLFVHIQEKLLRILLALNRIYLPDPRFKWASQLMEGMKIKPPDLASRLEQAFQWEPAVGVAEMQQLIHQTLALVKLHLSEVDIAFAERWYCQRRVVWDQAPAEVASLLFKR